MIGYQVVKHARRHNSKFRVQQVLNGALSYVNDGKCKYFDLPAATAFIERLMAANKRKERLIKLLRGHLTKSHARTFPQRVNI